MNGKQFAEKIGEQRVYNRELLEDVDRKLTAAKAEGVPIWLPDALGEPVQYPTKWIPTEEQKGSRLSYPVTWNNYNARPEESAIDHIQRIFDGVKKGTTEFQPWLEYTGYETMISDDPDHEVERLSRSGDNKALQEFLTSESYKTKIKLNRCPIQISFQAPPKEDTVPVRDRLKEFVEVGKEWKQSEGYQRLASRLSLAKDTVPVNKIVCFGFGSFSFPPEMFGPFLQHHWARSLSELLAALHKQSSPIPIFAQDPMYTSNDVEILSKLTSPPITIVNDPKGFLEIDEHTLVLSFYPDIPVWEVVADLTYPTGPAGIWCDNFHAPKDSDSGFSWKGAIGRFQKLLEPKNAMERFERRVPEMVRGYQKLSLRDRTLGEMDNTTMYLKKK